MAAHGYASRVVWLVLLLVSAAGAALAGGCGSGSVTPPGTQEIVGIVTSVEGSSPAQVSRFTLRTDAGQALAFDIGPLQIGGDTFPAGHLREHQATAQPVRVTYRDDGSRLVAVRLQDGP
jgi:hypothetical protein